MVFWEWHLYTLKNDRPLYEAPALDVNMCAGSPIMPDISVAPYK